MPPKEVQAKPELDLEEDTVTKITSPGGVIFGQLRFLATSRVTKGVELINSTLPPPVADHD